MEGVGKFMRTEPLSLEHQRLLAPKFLSMGMCLSEYSFTSRFLFRRSHAYEVLFEDMIWLRGKTKEGARYLMPTEDIRNVSARKLLEKLAWADFFYPVPESWTSSFDDAVFQKTYNRDDSDYLFKRTKIADYPGRDLSAKRNLLKQFLAGHSARVVPYEKAFYAEGLSILDAWQGSFKGTDSDYLPCKDGLELAQELGLSGYLVFADEKPAAFILGEKFPPNLFVIHFAKGVTQYKGIYPFLFKELAENLSTQEICCLNWEQDLGQEGLRQSKLSYQPDKIAHKYRISSIS